MNRLGNSPGGFAVAAATFLAMLLTACDDAGEIEVHAAVEDIPVAELRLVALPFDPQRILDSLAATAPMPRPAFPELEAELAAYRQFDERTYDEVSTPWRALRDSVAVLSDSLSSMDRRSPAYAPLYERFRQEYGRLAQQAAERDAEWQELSRDEFRLARRTQAAAESLRVWERAAYAPYTELATREIERTGRLAREVTTDSAGTVVIELEPGSWWLVARWPDPVNPFYEYAWSLGIRVTSWLPLRVPLVPRNTEWRWRH